MLSRAGWIISTLRHWVSERNVFLVEQLKLEKIVPSKSQNITDILTLFWFWKSFLNYALKIPFNCDWNVWGYWIISENQTCDHLRVRLSSARPKGLFLFRPKPKQAEIAMFLFCRNRNWNRKCFSVSAETDTETETTMF